MASPRLQAISLAQPGRYIRSSPNVLKPYIPTNVQDEPGLPREEPIWRWDLGWGSSTWIWPEHKLLQLTKGDCNFQEKNKDNILKLFQAYALHTKLKSQAVELQIMNVYHECTLTETLNYLRKKDDKIVNLLLNRIKGFENWREERREERGLKSTKWIRIFYKCIRAPWDSDQHSSVLLWPVSLSPSALLSSNL